MARIPNRSPSSFSRWLSVSSTVSSLTVAASKSFWICFFNLKVVSLGASCPWNVDLLPAVKEDFDESSEYCQDEKRQEDDTTHISIVACLIHQTVLLTCTCTPTEDHQTSSPLCMKMCCMNKGNCCVCMTDENGNRVARIKNGPVLVFRGIR